MPNAAPTWKPIVGADAEPNTFSRPLTITVTNDAGTTGVIPFATMRGGTFTLPTGITGVTFTFWVRSIAGGSLKALYSDAEPPVAVSRTVAANRSYPLPDALVGCYEFAIVSNVAGPETIEVNLKAA